MEVSPEDIEACRQRDGERLTDREAYVDEALRPDERVGFNEGAPLADRPYNAYPDDLYVDPEDVSAFLVELADHPLVTNTSALADEVNVDEDTAEDVAALYGLDLPSNGLDVQASDKPDDAIVLPNGEHWPIGYLADDPASDDRVLSQLLAADGMSVTEAARFLSDELRRIRDGPKGRWNVNPIEVKRAAKSIGLLPSDDSGGSSDQPRAEAGIVPGQGVVIRADDIET